MGDYISFPNGRGDTLRGRLFYPSTDATADSSSSKTPPPPVVIMAHGLGLTQDCSLEHTFVRAFTEAGMAAFTFDYATFGASTGTPRHDVNPHHQVADLQAAVQMLHDNKNRSHDIDASRMGLWGTSLGGGHALRVAATSGDHVKAVVAQVPALGSGLAVALGMIRDDPQPNLLSVLKLAAAAVKWVVQSFLLRGETWFVPVAGLPGSAGMLLNPGDESEYLKLIPKDGGAFGWRNLATFPSVLRVALYKPMNYIYNSTTPTMLIVAMKDTLCPYKDNVMEATKRMARDDNKVTILSNAQHFDVYSDEGTQARSSQSAVQFFKDKFGIADDEALLEKVHEQMMERQNRLREKGLLEE